MVMPILNDYQHGTRNAKVYKTNNGDYGVIVFDSNDDYNEFKSYPTLEEAKASAIKWVNNVSI